jgi:hypothetical protein
MPALAAAARPLGIPVVDGLTATLLKPEPRLSVN